MSGRRPDDAAILNRARVATERLGQALEESRAEDRDALRTQNERLSRWLREVNLAAMAEARARDAAEARADAAEAKALRDAATALERRAGQFKLLPGDKVRRQTHADIARWLRSRASLSESDRA